MGLARLDDLELARRVRERHKQANTAHRQRLLEAGKAQTNVWLSAKLRARLDAETVVTGTSLSLVVEALLLDGLAYRRDAADSVETLTACDSQPVESLPVDRDQRIGELKSRGLNNSEIGRQLGCSETSVRRVLKRLAAGESP